MSHFVELKLYIPSPEDDVQFLYAAANGTGQIGLWGYKDGSTELTVRVVAGPGTATPGQVRGSAVRVWAFSGLTAASKIQAFSGIRPFTAVLEVRIASPGNTLAAQNQALLSGSDPGERLIIGGSPVLAVALEKGIGDYANAPKMGTIRGLAVHITGGLGAANGWKTVFEQRGVSAHFVIGRSGDIVQYVAASIKAQAEGPGNSHFLSVEMVGVGVNSGACQEMTDAQLAKLRELWAWVRSQNPSVPNRLAWAYSGMRKPLSTKLTPLYRDMARSLSAANYCNGDSDSIAACIDSSGLSCHYWLDNAAKPCPGIGMIGQLPQVIGQPRVRVAGDTAFILS